MRRIARFTGSLVLLFALALLSWGVCSCPRILAEEPAKAVGPRADYFPKVTLKPHDDKGLNLLDDGGVDFYDLIKGNKTVVINVMYTRCDGELCGQGMANLVKVQKALGDRLGKDVFMYSITLDPEHDKPAVLKDYAETYKVKPGWTFLTGNAEDIEKLRRKLGFFDKDPKKDADRKQHSGMLKIGNEAIDKWTSASILDKPERILEIIDRVQPPQRSKK